MGRHFQGGGGVKKKERERYLVCVLRSVERHHIIMVQMLPCKCEYPPVPGVSRCAQHLCGSTVAVRRRQSDIALSSPEARHCCSSWSASPYSRILPNKPSQKHSEINKLLGT